MHLLTTVSPLVHSIYSIHTIYSIYSVAVQSQVVNSNQNVFEIFYQYFQQGFQYIYEHWDRVSPRFFEHLRITGISLGIALVLALPTGFIITRLRWLSAPVLGVLGVLYTIPSLAFLAFLVPVFGLGETTTIIVLIVYSQTILVRNVALAFNGIDPAIIEAAEGMGMSKWQRFWKVELALAVPVVVAGIRIVTLAIISIATIGAFVGAGGLGQLLRVDNPRLNAAGIICVVLLALVADQLYRLIERLTTSYRRKSGGRTRSTRSTPTPTLPTESPQVTAKAQ